MCIFGSNLCVCVCVCVCICFWMCLCLSVSGCVCVSVRVCWHWSLQCSTQEFYLISSTLARLAVELQTLAPLAQAQLHSSLLQSLLLSLPQLLAPARDFLRVLNENAAK